MKRSCRIKKCIHIVGKFCLYGYLAVVLLFALSAFAGLEKFVVTSGSMEPAIRTGSCLFVREKDCGQIQKGEIITFLLEGTDTAVTHRVIEKDPAGKCFQTKGDANDTADAKPVPYENVIGAVWLAVPLAGYLLVFLNSLQGKAAALGFLIVCVLVLSLTEDEAEKKNRTDIRKECK